MTARASTQPYVHAARSPADLLQYPLDSRLSVATTDDVRTDRRLARELGCPVGTRWRRIRTLRRARAGTPPLCWSDIYVRPEYAGVAEQIGRGTQPVYALLEATYGVRIAEVHVEIRAGLISDLLGAGLEAAPGTPSLDVLRRYTSVDKVIFEISLSVHPADRFAFSLDMRRGWQSGHGWTTV